MNEAHSGTVGASPTSMTEFPFRCSPNIIYRSSQQITAHASTALRLQT